MCRFHRLNKAFPKDSYTLPHIDRLVEATAGHKLLSFMDAFSLIIRYLCISTTRKRPHSSQIEESSITNDVFCSKNAGATYQRLVNKMFLEQLGKTIEVYIDDMLVKSLKDTDHIAHLKECLKMLNKYNMKLNPQSAHSE